MAIHGSRGFDVTLPAFGGARPDVVCFGEASSLAIVAVEAAQEARLVEAAAAAGVGVVRLGTSGGERLRVRMEGAGFDVALEDARRAFEEPIAEALRA